MKLSKLSLPVLLISTSIALFSCSKDDDNPGGDRLNAMFSQLRSTPQSFTVEAGENDTITGSKGTKVIFNPGSFKDNSGNTISSGSIQIELTEIYKPGQMIANRVNTVTTTGKLLTSGGQINIKAMKGSGEVKAANYGIAFRQSEVSEKRMSLFRGGPTGFYSSTTTTDNTIIWEDDVIMSIKGTSAINNEYFFLFGECTDFGWINCDDFVDDSRPKTNMTINLPDGYNNRNTQVFIVIPELNAVTSPRNYNAASNSFNMGTDAGYYLPIGMDIKIVTLATINDDQYYLEITDEITISEGLAINPSPLSQSKAAVTAALEAL